MHPTAPLLRRVRHFRLTTKNGPRDYYKGTRTGSMGVHLRRGGYRVDYDKVRHYVWPEGMDEFKLTPFVTKKMMVMRGSYPGGNEMAPWAGRRYLRVWKEQNGED